MRVLMTTDTVGGVWTYTRELVKGLLQRECEVTLISMGRLPSPEQQRWADRMTESEMDGFRFLPTEFPLEWMQEGAVCYEDSLSFVLEAIAAAQPEVLHFNQFCYGALPTDIPKMIVAHSDVLSWWRACRGDEENTSAWLAEYRRVVSEGLRHANCIVAPTEWMLAELREHYGPLPHSRVIANGRSIMLKQASRRPSTRVLRAVTAGRLWDEAKNVRLLADVHSPLPLYVAGDSDFGQTQPNGFLGSNVKSLGLLTEDELLELFSESAIYLVMSQYEPFGLAPIEAALSGCAIVANDIPSLREVWGDAAIYFETGDPRSLSAILTELASNPGRVRQLAAAALRQAQRYSVDAMTENYLTLYRELVEAGVESCGAANNYVA